MGDLGGRRIVALRLGGALLAAGWAATLLALPFTAEETPAGLWAAGGLGIALGVVVAARAQRATDHTLCAASFVALVQFAAAMAAFGLHASLLWRPLALHAAWVAFALKSRRLIAVHVALGALLLLVTTPTGDPEAIGRALATVPTLALIAGFITVLRERLERSEDALRALAAQDPLTGAANRRGLDARMERALADRAADAPLGLILLDLDGFKAVNDRLGHLRGDALLRDAADALRSAVRPGDLVSRHGGDEFALLLDGAGAEEVARICDRVQIALGARGLSAAVGSACFPRDGRSSLALLAAADTAQRAAKRSPRPVQG